MYDAFIGMGAGTAVGATVAVTVLPNTGAEVWIQLAVAIAAGLLAWGLLYARRQKRALKSRA